MAHEVDFSIPPRDLGRSDVEFNVKKDNEKIGTLKVSKGSVVWFPTDTSYGYLMLLDALLHRNGATNWAGKNVVSEECAVHHIFPREYLKDHEETRAECINCIGNLTLIDPGINSEIGDRPPEDYFQEYKDPEIFERHMIPSDPKLWKFENYERFLDARLKLMWTKAAEMLNELR